MKELVDAIRAQCAPATWQRAVQLARTAQVSGKRTHNDELELRMATKGGMTAPLVVLSPKHTDWSCECDSEEAACIHVAAAALYMMSALERGEEVSELQAPTAKVVHRLRREGSTLRLDRFLRKGAALVPLHARLAQLRQRENEGDLAVAQGDLNVDIALAPMLGGRIPRPVMERVLTALAQCTDVTLDDKPISVGSAKPLIRARIEDHPSGFRLVAEQDPEVTEVFDNGAVIHNGTLRPVGELDLSGRDVDELRKGRIYEFGQVADLVGRILPHLEQRLPVRVESKLLPSASAMLPRLLLQTEYDGEALSVLPTLVYGDPPCARVDGGKLTYLGGPLPLRNERKEERLASDLDAHLALRVGHSARYSGLSAVDMAERIRRFGHATVAGNGLSACFVAPELQASLSVQGDQFDLSFASADGEGGGVRHASAEAVLRAFRRGEALVPLTEGGFAPLPADFLARYGHLVADLVAAKAEAGELTAASAPDLARLCEALDQPPPPSFEHLRSVVSGFDGLPVANLPSDLTATLRPYQLEGIRWLSFLSSANLGGLLADDMGLGKTLQTLCVLGKPALVVCPASVLYNWQREIEKFRPGLRVHTYHGPQRELDMDADVTLTTYALLRNDATVLAAERWDTVVLDEAQNIKNADSQVARAAFELDARFRITLSGTPVENRLQELWSQIHFLNRGLLGGRRDFEERYARPIADGDPVMVDRLRSRIRPFLLRRLKADVAKDLPPRTDVVLRCTLSDHERAVYEAIRAATQQEVLAQLTAGGNVLAALEALLRMRQACCHSSLVPGQHAERSSKLDLLLETLDEALSEGHKALVFSQWTSLLDLIEPLLFDNAIPFCRLDGTTRDRGAVVDRFQSSDGPPVMLLSLRAGGIGLNLTAADHVFLMDPWWNPAVEDQAADRAHRIGQERPVLVHRLVAADSVEERMLELQEKKRYLAALATGDPRAGAGITRDDLIALLS